MPNLVLHMVYSAPRPRRAACREACADGARHRLSLPFDLGEPPCTHDDDQHRDYKDLRHRGRE